MKREGDERVLWPTRPTPEARPNHLLGVDSLVLVTTGHSELYGSKATIEDLKSALDGYSIESIFSVASRITHQLARSVHWHSDRDLQLRIAASILPPDALEKLDAFCRKSPASEGLVLFQERQVLGTGTIEIGTGATTGGGLEIGKLEERARHQGSRTSSTSSASA